MPLQIVPPGTRIDFVGRWHTCALASLLLIAVCAAAVPLRGIRLGVDFSGGTLMLVHTGSASSQEGDLRAILTGSGVSDASVIRVGDPSEALFQVQIPASAGLAPESFVSGFALELSQRIATATIEKVDYVGPRVGQELRRSAFLSLAIALALILGYVGFRFTPAYAPGAVVALLHDVLVVAGIFVLCGWEFDLNIIAALLTIVGYSLNDTIIIFDRIRENRSRHTDVDLTAIINQSVNETLSRTILTAGTTLLALLALFALGGPELRGFSGAMVIGILVGTYSSVYVAAPLMLVIEKGRLHKTQLSVRGRSQVPVSR